MNSTINISLPASMYADAKVFVKKNRYTSISELIRNALRNILYKGLTVNGFTEEFENMVLESAKEPVENDIVFSNDKEMEDYFLNLTYPKSTVKQNVKSLSR